MDQMLLNTKVLLLGLAALLLIGSIGAEVAYAEAGPSFHMRGAGEKGEGEYIGGSTPLEVQGEGGEQTLKGTIGTTPVVLKSPGVKITGSIWDNSLQGQMKLELKYSPITIVEPKLKECSVEMFTQKGAKNTVFTEGHLAWTWDGTKTQLQEKSQLAQKPDIIFTPPGTQIQEGATELPKGTFAEVKFTGAGCGVLAGIFKTSGSSVGSLKPAKVEEWGKALTVNTAEGTAKQHFWNGKEFIGVEAGLVFAVNPASLIGETKIHPVNQEIAIFAALALKTENVGGVPTRNTTECRYKNMGDKCSILFGNLLTIPIEVKSVNILGAEGTTRFKKSSEVCVTTLKLTEKGTPEASCIDKVEMKIAQAESSFNDYCIIAENKGTGTLYQICALLRIN
jgi:hypothetical protein